MRRSLVASLLALVTLLSSASALAPASAAPTTATTTSTTTSTTTPTAATAVAPSFGVALPDVPGTMAPLERLSTELGRRPDEVMWYVAWSTRAPFPAQSAAAVAAFGATPVITWEPWDPAAGTTQPAYALKRITAGAHDAYLTSWARAARAYGGPVVLRFAHEMNGSWYPWSAGVNGNTAADYVAAWRHVHRIFAKQRATNVQWSWSPNVPYPGSTALSALYPGDAVVSRVALDGYNWGGSLPGTSWTSFADLFGEGIRQVRTITTKPLHVGEVGAPEAGGDKPAWVRDMFAWLAVDTQVAGITWFSFDKESDWRIDSSAATLEAFRTGLATY